MRAKELMGTFIAVVGTVAVALALHWSGVGYAAGGNTAKGPRLDAEMETIRTDSGAEFDRSFARAMKQDHKKAIDIVDEARPRITDARLEMLIDELEPTLRTHKKIASSIISDMSGREDASSEERGGTPSTAQGRHSDHGG